MIGQNSGDGHSWCFADSGAEALTDVAMNTSIPLVFISLIVCTDSVNGERV